MDTRTIMARKAHMRTFARAHHIKLPTSFTTLWGHWGAASIYVLKEIQVDLHMKPTGVWDAALQRALVPTKPTVWTPHELALYCHYHGQPEIYTELTIPGSYSHDRWQGIRDHLFAPHLPHEGDCSSTFAWLYYACHRRDPNGAGYAYGSTSTLMTHGVRVSAPSPDDAVLYAWPGRGVSHVAMYVGGGQVVSHGMSGAPQLLPTAEMAGMRVAEYRHYD